jgi:steroid delta-isomerase-like uncharacterized protein
MSTIDVARENIDAFNAGDWGRFGATMSPDCVYDEPGTQRHVEGVDAVVDVNRGWKDAFPDAHGTVERAVAANGTATLEITWEGTQSGTLHTPGGDLPPSGRRVAVKAVQVIDVEGDKITESHHYFDMAGMLQQLGVAGQPTGATA